MPAKSKEQKAADRRARYQRYKSAGRCVQCQATLIEGELGVRCIECDEMICAARDRFESRNPGRRRGDRVYTPSAEGASARRDQYQTKKLAGVCVASGCREQASDDNVRCAKHRETSNRASRDYERRVALAKRAA